MSDPYSQRLHRKIVQREIERDMGFFEKMLERFFNWGLDGEDLERRLRNLDSQRKYR